MNVRKIEATNDAGETVTAYVIPDGYVCVLVSQEDAEANEDWRECAAVRIAPVTDAGRVAAFEIAPDLEALTEPAS